MVSILETLLFELCRAATRKGPRLLAADVEAAGRREAEPSFICRSRVDDTVTWVMKPTASSTGISTVSPAMSDLSTDTSEAYRFSFSSQGEDFVFDLLRDAAAFIRRRTKKNIC